ncbi:nectin-3-like protein isoform X1 [Lampetra planeri]
MSVRFIAVVAAIVVLTKANAKTMINVTSGDSAKMVCSYVAAANVTFTQMEWTKTKDNTVAILNPNNMIYIPDDYLGRVTMGVLHDEASEIVISNVTPADEGDYKCSVTTFPPAAREIHFTLKVNAPQPPPPPPPPPTPNWSSIILGVLFVFAAIAAVVFAYLWIQKGKNGRRAEDNNQPLRGHQTA